MKMHWAMAAAIATLTVQAWSQTADALASAARDATARLLAEQQRYGDGAATDMDLLERRRESIRAHRALAMRDEPRRVSALFEEEIHAANQQLLAEQRRFNLGASDDRAIAARRREVLAVRRAWAEWKQSVAAGEARLLRQEEIAVAEMQLAFEERRHALGAATADEVAQRRAELDALRERAQP